MIKFSKILLFLAISLIFTGCSDNDTWCEGSTSDSYATDDIRQVDNTTIKIYSVSAPNEDCNAYNDEPNSELYKECAGDNYGKWVDSQFVVKEGDEFDISVNGQIVIATDFESETNVGAGAEFMIPAKKGNATVIVDENGDPFDFAINQQITVTTDDCGTSTSDYCDPLCKDDSCRSTTNNCKPNKWTWDTGWKYDTVNCSYYTDAEALGFEESISNDCWAYRCCSKGLFGECWGYETWDCWHEDAYKQSAYKDYNICPTSPKEGESPQYSYPYICDGNEEMEPYYRPTTAPWVSEGGDCDGKDSLKSGSSPKCGDRNQNHNYASTERDEISYNQTGNLDTCWNTGGYRLYAMEGGYQCPVDCSSKVDAAEEDQCPTGCTHLRGSYATFDETHGDPSIEGGEFEPGVSFSSTGNILSLVIINPFSEEPESTEDLDAEKAVNEGIITQAKADNEDLYLLLTPQLNLIDDYHDVRDSNMVSLREQAVALNEGLVDDSSETVPVNAPIKEQLTAIEKLFNGEQTETVSEGIEKTFYTFGDSFVTNDDGTYTYDNDIYLYEQDRNSTSWTYTIGRMDIANDEDNVDTGHKVQDIIDAGNALGTTVTVSETGTTSADLQSFKDELNATMSALEVDMAVAVDYYNQIVVNNKEISDAEAENDEIDQQILESSTYGNDNLIGGYTVYVKGGPLVADNGECLSAVISDYNPNETGVLEDPEKTTKLFDNDCDTEMVYSVTSDIKASGTLWLKIKDRDERYDNNEGYYNLNMGRVTYTSGFDKMVTGLIEDIQNTVTTTAEHIFRGITCSGKGITGQCADYIKIITAMLYLYVIIFGMMYLFGLIKYSHVDLIIRIVKIATVTILIQPDSFEFFNTYLFQGFYGLSNTIISSATGAPVDNPFRFLTQNMNVLILDETTFFKVMGMMFQGLIGLVVFALIVHGLVSFVVAFFQAFVVYMISFVGMGLCLALGPVFIVFILFDKTRYLFDNWFKLMVKFTVQPVLLLVGLIIINGMLAGIIQDIFNYYVCFKCTLPITFAIPGYPQVGTMTLFCVSWFSAWGSDNLDSSSIKGLVTSVPLAITFCMITTIMRVYTDKIAGDVSKSITGSQSGMTTEGGNKSMGLNPFAGIDKQAGSFASLIGKEEEYKNKKLSVRRGAAKALKRAGMAVVTVNAPGASSLYAANKLRSKAYTAIKSKFGKKDLNPKKGN